MLSAEDLLAGASLTWEVEVPAALLGRSPDPQGGTVRLRPLTVQDLQVVSRAAKENDQLLATLMVQRALVEPEMGAAQVAALPVGLVQLLLDHVQRISGISAEAEDLAEAAEAPVARAAFLLAREFGWTPAEIQELTLGQVLLHLQMLKQGARP
ncbi:MAG TPA: hypothetical protein VKK31_21845 [Thermoanaerobaculia bacterium]|nr:hypothetical protein [Thermoanaerobaculia bacterium]